MKHVFWVIRDRLAGRCGPDRQPWDLAEVRAAGFGAVLSVNDGRLCHPEDFHRLEIAYVCVPLSPNAPPRPGDFDHNLAMLPIASSFVSQQLEQGRRVLVHCTSGKDRTGLLLAYCLMKILGYPVKEAMAAVLAAQPIAYSAEGWSDFASDVLTTIASDDPFRPTSPRGAT